MESRAENFNLGVKLSASLMVSASPTYLPAGHDLSFTMRLGISAGSETERQADILLTYSLRSERHYRRHKISRLFDPSRSTKNLGSHLISAT